MDQFIELTGATQQQAQFYLDSHAGDLESAVTAFVEDQSQKLSSSTGGGATVSASSSSSQPSKPASRVRTFRELMSNNDDDDSDDDEKYFAGGEKSGVMMSGGPSQKKNATDLVKDIISKAARAPAPSDPAAPSYFTGAGRRLGSEDEPAQPSSSSLASQQPAQPAAEVVERQLTFWKNGFSVDDGPLLRYDDPQNEEILAAINQGRAPTSLLNVQYGQEVEVKVAHRINEDYKEPAPKPIAPFGGSGQRLGGVTTSEPVSLPGSFPTTSSTQSADPAPRAPALQVDDSLPVTSLQIRLADGTRMVARMNHTHTVRDVRNFISASRPGEAGRPFILQTTFPTKDLTNEDATLKEAGLLNAVLVQRRL
ncbi:hypothetical protein HDV05_002842 [Chytridiales sp. JEL 0842]|nr:hypothetical protein HDV05_002842 [Chytridiales sp. JEL 0842]